MNVTLFAGTHPRHLYLAKSLEKHNMLNGLILEKRANFEPETPENIPEIDKKNFIRHFKDRKKAEKFYFEELVSTDFAESVKIKYVEKEELNNTETKQFIIESEPDILLTYGVHKLSDDILNVCPKYSMNIHGGLSPWYKGNITLFWPFYFLEPNWAGMTIHYLSNYIDAGEIIHHSVPILKKGDGIHDVACKSVLQVTEDIINIIEMIRNENNLSAVKQSNEGKLFKSTDWRPQHLRLIYNYFNNDIVDYYLQGYLGDRKPNLVLAF